MNVGEYSMMIMSYVIANLISMYIVYRLKRKQLIRAFLLNEKGVEAIGETNIVGNKSARTTPQD